MAIDLEHVLHLLVQAKIHARTAREWRPNGHINGNKIEQPFIDEVDKVLADPAYRQYIDVSRVANTWKANDERNKATTNTYPDGTPKTFRAGHPDLNSYGYQHATSRCKECGEWECDPNGTGHYRG